MTRQKTEDEVRLALEKVWHGSRSEALGRLATLEGFLENLRSGNPNHESRERALSAAHRLSGVLGMFGFGEASSCAAEIEALLCAGAAPDVATTAKLVDRLRRLLEVTQAPSRILEKRDS